MKVGDPVWATLVNNAQNAPSGLRIEGTVSATNVADGLIQIDTQFGIRIWVPQDGVKPLDASDLKP